MEFRDSCNSIGFHGRFVIWLLLHFMKKPASSSLPTFLSSGGSKSLRLHDERLWSSMEVIHFSFTAFAPDGVITRKERYVEKYKQTQGRVPTKFVEKLYTKALICGLMLYKKRIRSLFAEQFKEEICNNVHLHRSRNPSDALTQLAIHVDANTEIANRHFILLRLLRQPSRGPSSSRSRQKKHQFV